MEPETSKQVVYLGRCRVTWRFLSCVARVSTRHYALFSTS